MIGDPGKMQSKIAVSTFSLLASQGVPLGVYSNGPLSPHAMCNAPSTGCGCLASGGADPPPWHGGRFSESCRFTCESASAQSFSFCTAKGVQIRSFVRMSLDPLL